METSNSKHRVSFISGEIVYLDKDLSNSSKVKVVSQTSQKLFTTVEGGGVQWEVMTYRLSR